MRVRIEYRNKDLEIVDVAEFNFSDYCHLLSQKALSLIYQIEDYEKGKLTFKELKHSIFDLAGNLDRLPKNLVDKIDKEENQIKPPDKSFWRWFKK